MATTEQEFEAEIDRLAALQDFDRQLKERLDRVAELTAGADAYEAKVQKRRDTVAALTSERAELEKRRSEMDQRLEVDGGRMRDNRMRMSRVKTDRELMALQREIDLGKEAKQQLEEEMMAVMESLERIASELTEEEAALAELETEVQARIEVPRAEASELSEGLDGVKAERDEIAGQIDSSLRGKYEQIFDRRGGTAVVEATNGICTGCRMSLPPQLFNELQRYKEVRQCPSCHRIIFFRASIDEDGDGE
jgi:predicted  nucleic acid-binding Zn-ribbon protein